MKIIISGGSGQIGRRLIPELLQHGHHVRVLTRRPDAVRLPPSAEAVAWDGETSLGWGYWLDETDAVIHLAGENIGALPWSERRKRQILESRTRSGAAVVEAFEQANRRTGVLLQASGIGRYGDTGDRIVDEQTPLAPGWLAGVTEAWEASTAPVEALGVRRVILRSAPVLDAAEGILVRYALPVKLGLGGPLGSGRQYAPWIHWADAVGAMRFLLEHAEARGPFNLTAPHPVTQAEFTRTLARVLGRPYWLPAPAFALRLALGKMSELVLEGQRAVPGRLQALGYAFRFPELEPALRDLFALPAPASGR